MKTILIITAAFLLMGASTAPKETMKDKKAEVREALIETRKEMLKRKKEERRARMIELRKSRRRGFIMSTKSNQRVSNGGPREKANELKR